VRRAQTGGARSADAGQAAAAGHVDTLLRTTERAGQVAAAEADVVLATAHKAKGCEWRSVRLADDFFRAEEGPYPREEANLLCVAVTRAMDWLDPSGVAEILGDAAAG
jgi:superfamily I DNA/RNA helicase